MCQKLVALCYWYGTWQHGASRQTIESQTVAMINVRVWRLAAELVLLGDNGAVGELEGAWRLAV